jgi:predicted ATPase
VEHPTGGAGRLRGLLGAPANLVPVRPDLAFCRKRDMLKCALSRNAHWTVAWQSERCWKVLTRLRVEGFKNLLDVDVRFGPFTCVAGPNGAGKSNLFDAILFLHLLTKHPIMEAVRRLRETKGRSPEPRSLFTAFGSFRAPKMRFTADLIVDRRVQDDFGVSTNASISTLRYSVAFGLTLENATERLELIEESLVPTKLTEARRTLGFRTSREFRDSCILGRRSGAPFVSVSTEETERVIQVHQEGHGGRKVPAPKSSRTVLGGMASSDFPTVLAAHREMESWKALLLEPSAMRAPSFYQDERSIDARGANLAASIHRLQQEEDRSGGACAELANRLAELIEGVQALRIRDDSKTETLTLEMRGPDGIFHPARSLSDGTLRFLVLATLMLDQHVRGIICLEEPENGIHPQRVPAMVKLLQDIAVDPNTAVGPDNPLRQVVVNTHSPEVFQNVNPETDLIFVEEEQMARERARGKVAAVQLPTGSWRAKMEERPRQLAPGRVRAYLGHAAPQYPRQLWLEYAKAGHETV